jgi:hypothetical protein
MSAALEDYAIAEEKMLQAALRTLMTERGLSGIGAQASAKDITDTSAGLALAARDLYRATDALPRERQPKGWVTT